MLKATLHFTWRSLKHLTRITLVTAMLLVFIIAGILLGLRYGILPDIERYHGTIATSVSEAIGQPVSIARIVADWRGLRPHLQLTDVRVLDKQGQTALMLHQVDSVLSWNTLLTGQLHLYSLELNQPDLLIKRDAQGNLYIAGAPLSGESSGNSMADALLRQARIVVRDARITWVDEQRASPPLVLNQVNLLVENSWTHHHRFAVSALPPPELSTQLDVRGDFKGVSFDDLKSWHGQIYTRLDYADVAAWQTWLPQLGPLRSGKGALRGWLGVENGKISQVTADLALADVQTRLADNLPPLDLRTLHGRLTWKEVAQGFEVATHKLSLQMSDGLVLQPTDFYLRLTDTQARKYAGGEVRANALDLASLAKLADFLPLEQSLKQQLAGYSPRGRVSNLQVKWQHDDGKDANYEVKALFDQLSIKRTADIPGFSGLTGEVDGSDSGGTLVINAHKLTMDAPQFLTEPLQFDTLTAQSSWKKNKRGLEVKLGNISLANADAAGNAYGSFQTLPNSPGVIDLTVHLTRAAVRSTDRYIPLIALDKEAHEWVRNALLDGQSDDFRLRMKGDLNDFPFGDGKKGIFQIQARAKGVVVEYVKEWPRVIGATAALLIQGKRLEVTAPAGATLGAHLQNVTVVMPDMTSRDLMLQIRGESQAETARGLDFIQKSPVHEYIDGFTDSMTARGNGRLNLQIDVPLGSEKPVKVSGSYRFIDNEINLGPGIPVLGHTNGVLLFTESSMRTQNATAQILGGPATLSVQSGANGAVHAKVNGHADFDTLSKIAPHPLYSYLRGGSDWQAEITTSQKQSQQQTDVLVTSNLAGVISSLPAPFSKSAQEAIPLRFEQKSTGPQQEVVSLQYGSLVGARFHRAEENGNWIVKRGVINFGNAGKRQHREGVWITGAIPQLSLEGWGALLGGTNTAQADGASLPVIDGIDDLLIRKLSGFGQYAGDLHINAHNASGVFAAQLASREVNGEVNWYTRGQGRLVARLKNLYLYEDKSSRKKEEAPHKPASASSARTEFPTFDVAVDELAFKGKPLGKLELLAQQHERDWLVNKMSITNPDGALTADGKWSMSSATPQTQVNLKLEIANAGNILTRSGYPNSVKDGDGKLECAFTWPGGPDDFSYATLDGSLKLDTGKGQFLKIDPGIGKLLSILSLQALPKRIALDFTDVFSEGFKFDSISGTAQVKRGMLSTGDFKIEGSAAKVTMSGQIDLDHETQNLRVRVLPTVGSSVSLLSGFAGGPAVGVGVFIANKLLREPLDKLVSFEYNITGTWADPNVVKLGEVKPAK